MLVEFRYVNEDGELINVHSRAHSHRERRDREKINHFEPLVDIRSIAFPSFSQVPSRNNLRARDFTFCFN